MNPDLTPILLAFALGVLAVALLAIAIVWTYFVPRSKYEAALKKHIAYLDTNGKAWMDIIDLAFAAMRSKDKVIHTLKDQVARLNGRRDAKGRWMKVTK